MSIVHNRIANEAATLGIDREEPTASGERAQMHWRVKCQCGEVYAWGTDPAMQPTVLVQRFRNRGWRIATGKTPLCPKCIKETRVTKQTVGPDPKIARKVYGLLDDHFDEDKKLYKHGWNDQKIAAEVDTSPDLVATIRKGAYGELAEDPRIQGFRDDLELLRMELNEMKERHDKEIAEAYTKIAAVEQRVSNAKVGALLKEWA